MVLSRSVNEPLAAKYEKKLSYFCLQVKRSRSMTDLKGRLTRLRFQITCADPPPSSSASTSPTPSTEQVAATTTVTTLTVAATVEDECSGVRAEINNKPANRAKSIIAGVFKVNT